MMPSSPNLKVGGWGLGFGGWGLGFGVWGLRFGVWGLGFGVWGLGFGVWGLGFGVHLTRNAYLVDVCGCWGRRRLCTLEHVWVFGVWGLEFGVWGLGFISYVLCFAFISFSFTLTCSEPLPHRTSSKSRKLPTHCTYLWGLGFRGLMQKIGCNVRGWVGTLWSLSRVKWRKRRRRQRN